MFSPKKRIFDELYEDLENRLVILDELENRLDILEGRFERLIVKRLYELSDLKYTFKLLLDKLDLQVEEVPASPKYFKITSKKKEKGNPEKEGE